MSNINALGLTLSKISSLIRERFKSRKGIPGSESYWIDRYQSGRTSGDGSYGQLAEFKAEIINAFVRNQNIRTIIEYGCGDGNQLMLSKYPAYIGFDVSSDAVSMCKQTFFDDSTKVFKLMADYAGE